MANILQNHPLRFSIAASSSVPWIYLEQFWHTLKEDGSKYRLSFVLDRITMTLDDFRTIFQLPQATDNNHECFVVAPKFSEMVPFFLNDLDFTLELRSSSKFKTTGLVQPWQKLCKMFSRCLTTRVTGLHYSLEHPSTLIPYLRLTKLIVSHYMTAFPEISRRVPDNYHNLEDDEIVKIIFNSGKNKAGVGMNISSWMITDEMKLTKHFRMYASVFGVDVPTTQSQPIESTQGTHRTTSAPRSPNPDVDAGESSAQRKSTIIRLRIPPRRSTRLTPPTPILTVAEAEDITLQEIIQLSIVEQKSRDDLEAKQNEEKVKEHLMAEEIEKLVEGTENVENNEVVNSVINNQEVPGTRLKPKSYKESPEKGKGKEVEETRNTPPPTPTRSIRIHSTLMSSDTEKLQELTVPDPKPSSSTPSLSSPKPTLSMSQHILSLFKPKTRRFKRYKSFFDEFQG
ncbi:hypothetical protein Tco_0932745 [Tanacetum coccineum]